MRQSISVLLACIVAISAQPVQTPVEGTGEGVTMSATLRRDTLQLGQSTTPRWVVEMTVSNFTDADVPLGDSMIIVEQAAGSQDFVALYLARKRRQPSARLKQFVNRYALTWGAEVEDEESGLWPLAAIPGSVLDRANAILLTLFAPRVKGFPGGGYSAVKARSQYTLREEILAPVVPKAGRASVAVVAPEIFIPGAAVQPLFQFDSATFASTGSEMIPLTIPALAGRLDDLRHPVWQHLYALNWLFEADPAAGSSRALSILDASDASDALRDGAILNLAVTKHVSSVARFAKELSTAGRPQSQAVLIEALGEIGDPDGAEAVRPFLKGKNEVLRRIAARNLGKLRDVSSVDSLKEAADQPDEALQRAAAEALSEIGGDRGWRAVQELVLNRKAKFHARRTGMLAIGHKKYEPGLGSLIALATDAEQEKSIILNVIGALASFDTPGSRDGLKAICERPDQQTAGAALSRLSKSKAPEGLAAVLSYALQKDYRHRLNAVEAAKAAKSPTVTPAMKSILADVNASSKLRAAAFESIPSNRLEAQDRDALWDAFLKEKERFSRTHIADLLVQANFRDESAIGSLIAGLNQRQNPAWHANVKLLRAITGQHFGPESEHEGNAKSRQLALDKWRDWWKSRKQ